MFYPKDSSFLSSELNGNSLFRLSVRKLLKRHKLTFAKFLLIRSSQRSTKYDSYTPILIDPTKNRTPQEDKEWANLAYDRTFRFGKRRHYVPGYPYAFGIRGRTTRNRDKPAGEKRNGEERERERKKREHEKKRVSAALLRCFELFYSLNIGPNQTPSALRAREYKCSPSRLYNHGSVKLTSQSCNQPRNSARSSEHNPNPGHRPLSCVLKFLRCPKFKSMPAVFTVDETFKWLELEFHSVKTRTSKILLLQQFFCI